jgi:hypothetical protein
VFMVRRRVQDWRVEQKLLKWQKTAAQ